jgi:hypothetical protein
MSATTLVLVEPGAHRPGGHRHRTLAALARADGHTLVVAPQGVTAETRAALETAGARLTGPAGAAPGLLAAGGRTTAALASAGRRLFASRRWPTAVRRLPHQVTLVSRCLTEAACVRAGRARADGPATVVVLSASEALHGLVGLLGGPHLRYVHELVTTEDTAVRWLGRLARAKRWHVRVISPTRAVHDGLAARFPGLPMTVRPFCVVEDDDWLDEDERARARDAFGIPAAETAVCLVGGWWPYKDLDVVDAALTQLDLPVHLLVAGDPLDHDRLQVWAALPHVRLRTIPGPLDEAAIRAVYAAADATLVTRRPGVGKESGLVVDAARLGIPLIICGHDVDLVRNAARKDWVRAFPPGDGDALAAILDGLAPTPVPRPARTCTAELGVPTATDQVGFLLALAEELC